MYTFTKFSHNKSTKYTELEDISIFIGATSLLICAVYGVEEFEFALRLRHAT